MKLKEVPGSLSRAWQLRQIPLSALAEPAERQALDCIISLTSIPSRLGVLHLTIRSLLSQQLSAEKVVLWLHRDLAGVLPAKLSRLQSKRFEIRYSDQTCAHRKLVESLKSFPGKVIVTSDDDMMYPANWLASLWSDHLKYSRDIIANECRHIGYTSLEPLGYRDWRGEMPGACHPQTLAIGYGGVLYPEACLDAAVTDAELYNKLAPRADDLWFKAMSLLKGTLTRRATRPAAKPTPIMFSQRVSLKRHNVRADGNLPQWQALDAHFGLGEIMVSTSNK